MKNGIIGIVGLALFAVAGVAQAQIVHLRVSSGETADISIPEGRIMSILVYQNFSTASVIRSDGEIAYVHPSPSSLPTRTVRDLLISGASVQFNENTYVTYQFVDPPSTEGLKKPSTAVVIPADDGGDVEIIMESSTDMVTWTEALPGTYGTDTAKRFFRLRAVRVAAGE